MSEPGAQPSALAAAPQERLWDKAPGWRTLVMAASVLTLAAVATPLLLPQPAAPVVAPAHGVIASAPKPVIAPPANPAPVQTAMAPHHTVIPPIARPVVPIEHHAAAETPDTALVPAQPEPGAGLGGPVQPPAAESGTPAPDLASLPVGTKIVPSGILDRVNRHNRYSSQTGDLPITITIITPPAHGTVSTQPGTAVITFANAGVTRVSSVTNVFYQSAQGYVGQDSFTYKRTSPDPTDPLNNNTYTVNVYVK